MADKRKRVLNKQTGEYGVWTTSKGQPVFIADGETLEQACARLSKPKEYRQNASYDEIIDKTPVDDLDNEELETLRQEVIRKNVEQGTKVKPTNCAFTANHFVVYKTSGGDTCRVVDVFDMETDRFVIDRYRRALGDK